VAVGSLEYPKPVLSPAAPEPTQGYTKHAALRAKEAGLNRKMDSLKQESNREIEKGKAMLRGQHRQVGSWGQINSACYHVGKPSLIELNSYLQHCHHTSNPGVLSRTTSYDVAPHVKKTPLMVERPAMSYACRSKLVLATGGVN
jgi:hypothetical protein